MAFVQWLDEKTASKKIGRSPRTLRRLAKSGKLKIDFTAINGRTYQYSERSIEKVLLSNSSIVTS